MVEREKASCACFDAAYAPAGANATVPATETRFTTCASQAARRPGAKRAKAPDPAEVVDVRVTRSIELRIDVEEAPARGDPGVVDEEPDRGMALEHSRRDLVDLRSIGDVADLPLAADLRRDPLELALPAREEHAVPAVPHELARGRLPDTRRGSRDHCDALAGHRRATLSD